MLRKNYIVLFVLFVIVKVNTLETSKLDNVKILEEVVKKILKISPPDEPVDEFQEDQQPPKHMLELYHRFTTGRRDSGETVRSITPNIDSTKKDETPHSSNALTFTLSHIADNEEVRLAQLVLRRRRNSRHPHPLHRKLLPPPYRVRVFEIVEGKGDGRLRIVPLASIPVPQVTRGGWHSLDITSAVRELLLSSSSQSKKHILGIRFEAPRSKVIPASHFLDQRDNTSSFLILFTEESKDNEVKRDKQPRITSEHIEIIKIHVKPKSEEYENNHIKQRHHKAHHTRRVNENNPRRHKNKNIRSEEDNTDIKELIDMNEMQKLKRHKKLFESFDLKYDDERESENRIKIKSNLINELLENSETKRVIRSVNVNGVDEVDEDDVQDGIKSKRYNRNHRRRSIFDNEVPYEKLHIKSHSKTLTTTAPTEVVTDIAEVEEEDDKNLIPYPPGMGKKKKRKWRRGKRKNRGKTTKQLPDEWNKDDLENHHRLQHTNSSSSNQSCARRHLVVKFKELGWSNWVIAPKLFNAHYCAGSCSFPVPENVPVTNHAIIQSLVHDRQLRKGVPAPCCVPHSMSPLTILYLQDNNHVILRNYRSMTVETCGCR